MWLEGERKKKQKKHENVTVFHKLEIKGDFLNLIKNASRGTGVDQWQGPHVRIAVLGSVSGS